MSDLQPGIRAEVRRPATVFIVEDSPAVRDRLILLLGELHDREAVQIVGHADNEPEALESIGRLEPDLLLLDIALALGNGNSLLGRLRGTRPDLSSKSRPIVLVLTNSAAPASRRRSLELGADYFFDKSSEFDLAIRTIGRLVRGLSMPTSKE